MQAKITNNELHNRQLAGSGTAAPADELIQAPVRRHDGRRQLWGVFIWQEFKNTRPGTNALLALMFALFVVERPRYQASFLLARNGG